MSDLVEGQVARILNSRELAINRGEQDGVTEGMRFEVLDPMGEDITDPETGEILGSVMRPKVEVEVFTVQDRLSLARTFRSKRVNVGGVGFDISQSSVLKPPRYVTRWETFKTDEKTWEDLPESESYVKVGDPVREVRSVDDAVPPAADE